MATRQTRLTAVAVVSALSILVAAAPARAAPSPSAPPPSAPPVCTASTPLVAVILELDPAARPPSPPAREVWDALRAGLQATPLPSGVRVDVRDRGDPAPGQAWVRVQGSVVAVGALELLALSVSFDPADARPDLSLDVQGRRFDAATSREWLVLPATVVADDKPGRSASDGKRAATAAAAAPLAFLRGVVTYLAHRRLPPACLAEAAQLKTAAITWLRRWDGPRQEEVAADASALAKQLRAFLQFGDDGCAGYDGGEDPARLLIAAARLTPHRSESRRLAVMAQLHRADHPAGLCGASLERDLLASVAIAPGDEGALRDAGLAYDVLAQGPPRAFASGQEVNRVEALRQMRRVPEAYRPSLRGFREVGLGALASFGGSGIAPGARLEVWLGPAVIPLALRAAVEITSARTIPIDIGSNGGAGANWRRDAISLGIGYRLGTLGPFVNLFATGALASAHIDGHGFEVNQNTSHLDAGVGAGARAGWRWGNVALSVEVVDHRWLITQSAEVQGLAMSYPLPHNDLSVALLLSLAGGIKLR